MSGVAALIALLMGFSESAVVLRTCAPKVLITSIVRSRDRGGREGVCGYGVRSYCHVLSHLPFVLWYIVVVIIQEVCSRFLALSRVVSLQDSRS